MKIKANTFAGLDSSDSSLQKIYLKYVQGWIVDIWLSYFGFFLVYDYSVLKV